MSDIYEKQVLTDKFVEVHGAKPDNRVQQQMDAQGAKIKEMTRNSYAQHIRNSATAQMESAYAQHADDPTALDSALKDIRKGTMDEIVDPVVAASFSADFDLKSASLVAKSKERFITRQREDQKSALMGAMDLSAEDMVQSAIGMFETDDADVAVGYMHARQTMTDAINATDDRGRNVFSDAERARRTKEISTASITGLKNFLENPNTDPVRIRTVIDRFGKGEYDDMFSTKDYPTAARLLKAADKQLERDGKSGSGSDDIETPDFIMFERVLESSFQEKNGDKDFKKANMNDLVGFRTEVANAFNAGKISKKEYQKLMSKTAIPTLQKIREYGQDTDFWNWRNTPPLRQGIHKLDAEMVDKDFSTGQQLYVLEAFLQDYAANGGTDANTAENRALAEKIANQTIESVIKFANPKWNPETTGAIVMGGSVYRTPGGTARPTDAKMYKIMEIDTQPVKSAVKDIYGE